MKGLCPACNEVIESNSVVCPYCGVEIKLSMIPAERRPKTNDPRIRGKYWCAIIPAAICGMTLAKALFDLMVGFDSAGVNLILAIISGIFCVCFFLSYKKASLVLCLEELYRKKYGNSNPGQPKAVVTMQEPPKAPIGNAAEQIKQYKELLDDGAITQEEYDIKKKELLGL